MFLGFKAEALAKGVPTEEAGPPVPVTSIKEKSIGERQLKEI